MWRQVFVIDIIKKFLSCTYEKEQCKKKCSVVSVSVPRSHIGNTESLKLWRNLCSFKWLDFNLSLIKSLTPVGSWIENNDLSCKEMNFIKIDLEHLMFTDISIKLSCLFHSLIQNGKKEYFKRLILVQIPFILFRLEDILRCQMFRWELSS